MRSTSVPSALTPTSVTSLKNSKRTPRARSASYIGAKMASPIPACIFHMMAPR
jgi:hypothetical protein